MENDLFDICPIAEYSKDNKSVTIGEKAEDWYKQMWNVKDCPAIPSCNRTIYKVEIQKDQDSNWAENKAYLKIQLESPNVQKIVDTYSYDLQSLIGEVGGTLGLFLGLSTYSFVEFIEYLIKKLSCQFTCSV